MRHRPRLQRRPSPSEQVSDHGRLHTSTPEAVFHSTSELAPQTTDVETTIRDMGHKFSAIDIFPRSHTPTNLSAPHGLPQRPSLSSALGDTHAPAQSSHVQRTQGTLPSPDLNHLSVQRSSEQDAIGQRIQSAAGKGSSLDPAIQRSLESGLGANLSSVRVHTDGEADRLSRSVNATAFTTGSDIFFRAGSYNPHSSNGLHLIAHEAAHTVQQAQGAVDGTPAPGGVSISTPNDRFERAADLSAAHAVAGVTPPSVQRSVPSTRIGSPVIVQRQNRLSSIMSRTFSPNIAKNQKKQEPISNEEIARRYNILQTALKKEAAEKQAAIKDLEDSGATKEEATARINKSTVGEHNLLTIPEDFRPRRITPAEKQVKRNQAQALEERVLDAAAEQNRQQNKLLKPENFSKQVGRDLKANMAASRNDPEKVRDLQDALKNVDTTFAPLGDPGKSGAPGKKEIDTSSTDDVSDKLDKVAYLPTIGGGLATGSGQIAKLTGNTTVSGTSKTDHTTGQKIITSVGTAKQGSDIQATAKDLLGVASTISELMGAVEQRKGDPAQVATANNTIVDSVFSLGQGAIKLGGDGAQLAGDFGGAAMATNMAGHVVPGLGLATAAVSLVKAGLDLARHSKRMIGEKANIKAAKKGNNSVLQTVIQHLYDRGVQLVSHVTTGAVANILVIVGDALILSVVGSAAGAIVKLTGSLVAGANTAAKTLIDSYHAGKTQESRRDWMLAEPGSAEKLLADDPFHVAQTLIILGRDGHADALAQLKLYGIDATMLAASKDSNLRQLILQQVEENENPKTVTQKLLGMKKLVKNITDLASKPKQIHELRKAKNKVGYGGRTDRGFFWGMQQFFGGDVKGQNENIYQVIKNDPILTSQEKSKLLKATNASAYELREPTPGGSISKPLHLMPPPLRGIREP